LSVGQGNQHPDSESWKGSQSGNGHKAKQFINQAIGIDEGQPLNPTRMNSLVDYQV
jgi:hypothetical protein